MRFTARAIVVVPALALALVTALGLAAAPSRASGRDAVGPRSAAKPAAALSCALSDEQVTARRDELLPGFLDRAESVTELRDGLRLTFARRPGLVKELAGLIENEQACCSFLSFRLVTTEGAGPVTLEVRGPRGTAALLKKLRES